MQYGICEESVLQSVLQNQYHYRLCYICAFSLQNQDQSQMPRYKNGGQKTEHITKQLFRAFYTNNFGWRLQCNHEVFHSFLLSCKNYIFYVMTHKDCGIL